MPQDDDGTKSVLIDVTMDISRWEAIENIVIVGVHGMDEVTVTDDNEQADVEDDLLATL